MAIQDDFSIAANGDIRWTGTTATYSVLEFHRWLQDYADDAVASGDDLLDITDLTPSDRSTDNIIALLGAYNVTATEIEHLYDGSLSQANGDVFAGLVVVGSVPAGTELQIVQDNALLTSYWGTGLNADASANILLRIMVQVSAAGVPIDGQRLRVQARELGDTYAEFSVTMGLGNNTAAIFTSADLNNQTAEATLAAIADITNIEGLNLIDVNGNGTPEEYYSQWDLGANSINDLYEYTKWIQRRGTAETIYGMNAELFRGITHSIAYDNEAVAAFAQNEVITFGNGATAAVLAIDDDGATGNLYVQLLTGVAPADNDTITGGTSGATADVNGAPVARTISPEFLGASTGSSVIGAYAVGIEATDLSASDQLFDTSNTLQVPPNNVTFTVNGLVTGEDRVLVGPELAGGLDTSQLSANGAQTAGATTFVVNEAIPTDTPSSGTIRVFDGSTFARVEYSSYSGSTFTLTTTLGVAVADAADVFVSYIDVLAGAASESFTSVFLSTRSLFVRVRDGGGTPIKTFETTGSLGSGGGSTTAIRTSDE